MINERCLRFREVRLIDADNKQVGVVGSREALARAQEAGLDLVLVSESATPPVCRIIDYGRHKYETERRERENKKKQQEVKGIKISPRIAMNDIQHLLKNARRFLEEQDKVKVVCQFKAREVTHPELGKQKLDYMFEQLSDIATVERTPTLEGKMMVMILLPKPKTGKQNAKAQNKQDGGQAVQDHGVGEDHPAEGVQQPPVLAQERQPEAPTGE